jgi:hypothetical protein
MGFIAHLEFTRDSFASRVIEVEEFLSLIIKINEKHPLDTLSAEWRNRELYYGQAVPACVQQALRNVYEPVKLSQWNLNSLSA